MNKKTYSLLLIALLISSATWLFETLNTTKALATPTIVITASANPICANNTVTLTASINGGSSPDPSKITWASNSTTGYFNATSGPTVTYNDTSPTSLTNDQISQFNNVTITATYPQDANNAQTSSSINITVCYQVDLNHDGLCNFQDLVYFINQYVKYNGKAPNDPACDLALPIGKMNFDDLKVFVKYYIAAYQ